MLHFIVNFCGIEGVIDNFLQDIELLHFKVYTIGYWLALNKILECLKSILAIYAELCLEPTKC